MPKKRQVKGNDLSKKKQENTIQHNKENKSKKRDSALQNNNEYLWSMSHAPKIEEGYHWLQTTILAIWTAVIIMLVYMVQYERDMSEFFWSPSSTTQIDFFSYCKMVAILIVAGLTILILLYRLMTQSFALKKSSFYIPMAVYSVFVILSYIFSDYKEFAWLGYNDRFEGTIVLLAYMLMLFYAINTISTEKHVKIVVFSTAVTSAMLGILGVTQAMGKDFFRTPFGQKLISPNSITASGLTMNEYIDSKAELGELAFDFTFQYNEIYQTVYNINYVSFYLTLLIPLFGLLFIYYCNRHKEEKVWKAVLLAALFGLLLYNLIGSASSGGIFGMAIVVLFAFILLNKRILQWWKPVAVLLLITAIVGGMTTDRWLPEVKHSLANLPIDYVYAADEENNGLSGHLDYFETDGHDINISMNGEKISIYIDPDSYGILPTDSEGNRISITPIGGEVYSYSIDHEAFKNTSFYLAQEAGEIFFVFKTNNPSGRNWNFIIEDEGIYYFNDLKKTISLYNVPAIGFEDDLRFGSGRGYIWSRTFPMMKDTLFIGNGADTYCIAFPQEDYVGKYNALYPTNIIVDKPHNMYMGMWTGTGMISCLAFLAMILIYTIQTFKIYIRKEYKTFMEYAGIGIYLGIIGFVFTGLVDDSSVSVMPMFYGLLGTGVAINMVLASNVNDGQHSLEQQNTK